MTEPQEAATLATELRRAMRLLVRVPRLVLLGLIRVYQLVVSPWTPASCRYYPSCSAYAATALQRHGVLRGGWLAARRLGRCHPWTPGGVEHVPPARAGHSHGAQTEQVALQPEPLTSMNTGA